MGKLLLLPINKVGINVLNISIKFVFLGLDCLEADMVANKICQLYVQSSHLILLQCSV